MWWNNPDARQRGKLYLASDPSADTEDGEEGGATASKFFPRSHRISR